MSRPNTPPPPEALLVSPPRSGKRPDKRRGEDDQGDRKSAIELFLARNSKKVHGITLVEFQREADQKKIDNKFVPLIEAALHKIQEIEEAEGAYDIEFKPGGFADGFIITNSQSGRKYFIKEFLNPPESGQIDYAEFFTYKALQYLGYGPKCHAALYGDQKAILISEDLSTVKTKGDGSITRKKFQTYQEINAEKILDAAHFTNFSDQFCAHLMAVEILIKLLAIRDVHFNPDNAGLVITAGPKTAGGEDKIKPKIVDFVCDTESDLEADPQCSKPSNKLTLEEVVALTESSQHSSSHISKITRARKEQAYLDALTNIIMGRGTSRPPIAAAIDRAFANCREIMGAESDPVLEKRISEIKGRVVELEKHLTTLSSARS